MTGDLRSAIAVDHAVTAGTFSLDGETFEVENNIWVVGDDDECVVIDAPHSVDDILAVVAGRKVSAIILTHAHDDHCRQAPALREATGAPIYMHPDDRVLWELTHGPFSDGVRWDFDVPDGWYIRVGGSNLRVIHTPGHAPGAICLYSAELGCVFTGDTLFHGGPGATGRSHSDKGILENSIRERLFVLPPDTVVHTGHGEDTTIADERSRAAAERLRHLTSDGRRRRLPGDEAVP